MAAVARPTRAVQQVPAEDVDNDEQDAFMAGEEAEAAAAATPASSSTDVLVMPRSAAPAGSLGNSERAKKVKLKPVPGEPSEQERQDHEQRAYHSRRTASSAWMQRRQAEPH